MKKFIVDTGDKKYKVEANTYDEAISAVKAIQLKDEASPLQTVNALLEDERAAVDAYNVALENLKGKIPDESYAAIEAIRNDENRHIENLQAVVNGNVTEKNLEDSVKDMPLTFRSNLNLSALKSNVQNFLSNPENTSSLVSNLRSIDADIEEWKSYASRGTFRDNPNLKDICRKLAEEYLNILDKASDVKSSIRNDINRVIANIANVKSNYLR